MGGRLMPRELLFLGPGGLRLGHFGPARFESRAAIVGPPQRASRVAEFIGSRVAARTEWVYGWVARPRIMVRQIVSLHQPTFMRSGSIASIRLLPTGGIRSSRPLDWSRVQQNARCCQVDSEH